MTKIAFYVGAALLLIPLAIWGLVRRLRGLVRSAPPAREVRLYGEYDVTGAAVMPPRSRLVEWLMTPAEKTYQGGDPFDRSAGP